MSFHMQFDKLFIRPHHSSFSRVKQTSNNAVFIIFIADADHQHPGC